MASPSPDAARSAGLLGERYRLDRRIAVGGMGEVWRAEDVLLHRPVAVKVLKTEFTQDPTFLGRFRNEARLAASFSHAGIAGVYDYGETADRAYLVMELVEGEPLSAILAREHHLSFERTLDYVEQAAVALEVAHRAGMVHRDIKPGNLLVTARGEVKITDFGVARAASAVPLTSAGMVVGTAQYFSPEQAEGTPVGPASDVYSLGVLAFECLTGHLPFWADSPITVAMMHIRNVPPPLPPTVPPPVRAVVERAMAKDPSLRYPTGGAMAAAVRAAREGRIEPPPLLTGPYLPPPPAPMPHRGRGRAVLITLGLVVVIAAAVIAIVLVVTHHRDKRDGTPGARGVATGTAAGSVTSSNDRAESRQ